VRRLRGDLRCKQVELVNRDVLDYEIPDDVTVAYFYNPFTGSVFRTVLEKLVASIERAPRELRIIYVNPVEEALLLIFGARVIRRIRGWRPSAEWSRSNSIKVYSLSPD
jgi:hypothetical protein